jgi:hypothetical protein
MRAPLTPRPQRNGSAPATHKSTLTRSLEQTGLWRRSVAEQVALNLGTQDEQVSPDARIDHETRQVVGKPREVSDFSRIPAFGSDHGIHYKFSFSQITDPMQWAGRRAPAPPAIAHILQTKLAINQPGDSYEQEADRVAERVMRAPDPRLRGVPPGAGESRDCRTEQPGQDDETLQMKRVGIGDKGHTAAPPIVHEVLRSPGQPLDPATRAFMEPRFRHDFSRVRVHAGAMAEESAGDVKALAYTVGPHVVFGAGRFAPDAHAGRRLLAHELVHVVQQGGAAGLGRTNAPGTVSTQLLHRAPKTEGVAAAAPSPPSWLGSWKSKATHVKGNIWNLKLRSMGGDTWVGPYRELAPYIEKQGLGAELDAAHIIGGEHLQDLGSLLSYEDAPCIAAPKGVHVGWSDLTGALQAKYFGGRSSNKPGRESGRTEIGPKDVDYLYHELYRGKPELQEFARNIVKEYGHPPAAPPVVIPPAGQPVKPAATPRPSGVSPTPQRRLVAAGGGSSDVTTAQGTVRVPQRGRLVAAGGGSSDVTTAEGSIPGPQRRGPLSFGEGPGGYGRSVAVGEGLLKLIAIVGDVLFALQAKSDFEEGDYVGGGLNATAATSLLLPEIGGAAAPVAVAWEGTKSVAELTGWQGRCSVLVAKFETETFTDAELDELAKNCPPILIGLPEVQRVLRTWETGELPSEF